MHNLEPWLLIGSKGVLRILVAVLIGVTVGTVFEYRNGIKYIYFLSKPLLRFSRLPSICGTAFITAFFSNVAAASMLAGAYSDGKITRRDMIIGAILNSFPAYTIIMVFVMFILIPLIGEVGIIYCSMVIVLDLFRTVLFLIIIRLLYNSQSCSDYMLQQIEPSSWGETLEKTKVRILKIFKRLVFIALPLYLLITYLVHIGIFDFINKHLPSFFTLFLPPEVITIVIAKFAGLTTAATVAMGMVQMSKITTLQVLLAFFAGNIFNIPIRSIKHNLPIALGIYPEKTGLWIILILESSRMLMSIFAVIVLGLMIHFT
jgi:hypothetical protein